MCTKTCTIRHIHRNYEIFTDTRLSRNHCPKVDWAATHLTGIFEFGTYPSVKKRGHNHMHEGLFKQEKKRRVSIEKC